MSNLYTRHDLAEHLRHTAAEYAQCVERPPRGLWKLQSDTVEAMRACVPVAGHYYESHLLLSDGRDVPEHTHPEWVALWYADPGDPPHPVIIAGEAVYPAAGECIVIPPGVRHHVEVYESKHPRILFAVLVEGE